MAWHPMRGVPGTGVQGDLYVIHFSRPFGHAEHYQGWTEFADGENTVLVANGTMLVVPPGAMARYQAHTAGRGANLTARAVAAGIELRLGWTGTGDRYRERQLKNAGGRSVRERCAWCRPRTAYLA